MESASKVNLLAIIQWVAAGLLVLLGLLLIFVSFMVGDLLASTGVGAEEAAAVGAAAMVGGVITGVFAVIFAVLYFLIGRGLWKRQNWARITALVLAWIGVVAMVLNLLLSVFAGPAAFIVMLIWTVIVGGINALFIWWLQFDAGVVALFARPVAAVGVKPLVKSAVVPTKAKPKTVKSKKKQ
jgi:hypothetical protein